MYMLKHQYKHGDIRIIKIYLSKREALKDMFLIHNNKRRFIQEVQPSGRIPQTSL